MIHQVFFDSLGVEAKEEVLVEGGRGIYEKLCTFSDKIHGAGRRAASPFRWIFCAILASEGELKKVYSLKKRSLRQLGKILPFCSAAVQGNELYDVAKVKFIPEPRNG